VSTRSGGLPQLDPIALGIGDRLVSAIDQATRWDNVVTRLLRVVSEDEKGDGAPVRYEAVAQGLGVKVSRWSTKSR
jgi:hypothetical protein